MAAVTRRLYDSLLLDGYDGLPDYDSFEGTLRTNGDARLQLYKSLKSSGFSDLPDFIVFNNDLADSSQVLGPLRMGRTGRAPDVARESPPRDNTIQPPVTTEPPDLPQRSAWANALTRGLIDLGEAVGDLTGPFYGEEFRKQHRMDKAEIERRKTQPVYSLRQVGEKWKSEGILGAAKELGGFVLESGLESAPMIALGARSPTAFFAVLNEMYAADIAEKEGLTEQGWVERLKAVPITTVVGILGRLGIKNRRGSTGVGSVLKRTGVEQGLEFGEGVIEEAGTSVMAGQPVSWSETLWKGAESAAGTTLPNLSLEAGSAVVNRTGAGHRIARAIDAQVDNATPLPRQPVPNVRQGQAPSMRDLLEAKLNEKGYRLPRSRENFANALGVRPIQPEGSLNLPDQAAKVPEAGSEQLVKTPDIEPVVSPEQAVGETRTSIPQLPETAIAPNRAMQEPAQNVQPQETFDGGLQESGDNAVRREIIPLESEIQRQELEPYSMAGVTRRLYDTLQLNGYDGLPDYDSFEGTLRTNGDARLQLYKSLKSSGFSDLPDFIVFNNDLADSSQVLGPLRMGRTERAPDVARESPPQNNIVRAVGGLGQRVSEIPGNVSEQWQAGQLVNEQGLLLYKQMAGHATQADRLRIAEIDEEINRLGGRETIEGAVAEILGQMSSPMPEALAFGAASAGVAGGVAALAGQIPPATLLPEEFITVPATMAVGFTAGTISKIAENTYKVEAGHAYKSMMDDGIDHNTASVVAMGVGIVNVALERTGLKFVGAPFKKMLMKEMVKKGIKIGKKGGLKTFVGSYMTALGEDTAVEVVQEINTILAGEIARFLTGKESLLKSEEGWEQIAGQLWDVLTHTAKGESVIALPGAKVDAVKRRRRRPVTSDMKNLPEPRETATTDIVSPEQAVGETRTSIPQLPETAIAPNRAMQEPAQNVQPQETFESGLKESENNAVRQEVKPAESTANKPVDVFADSDVKAASQQVDTVPTEAQKEAGNFKKGHVRLHGFDITIKNPKGSERSGMDKSGKKWPVTMQHAYGYIKRIGGKDGGHVDVFIGNNPGSPNIYVIDQVVDGKFDKHKVMMGLPSMDKARRGYLSNYEQGWDGLGNITEMSVDQFKDWLKNGSQKKPVRLKRLPRQGSPQKSSRARS